MREIISAEEMGNLDAERAIKSYVYRIKKYIGSYVAVLGGVDAIVFSGTIGERSRIIREKICKELAWTGAILDLEKNTSATSGTVISTPESSVKFLVLAPDEESEILEVVKIVL
jgi:acetate kinase